MGIKDIIGKHTDYQSAVTQGRENKENPHDFTLTSETEFTLSVRQALKIQEFVVYVSFITDLNEQKWLGFGNVKEIVNHFDSEFIFRVGMPDETSSYDIKFNFIKKIAESSLNKIIKGTPIRINRIRFRSDLDLPEPIHFYYAFKN